MRRLLLLCCLLPAACAGDEPRNENAPVRSDTRLEVRVWPAGERGRMRREIVTALPAGLTRKDLEPVARDVVCAAVYGGPAVARVRGTLDGEPIDTRFNRTNSCETARWDGARALLGATPDTTP